MTLQEAFNKIWERAKDPRVSQPEGAAKGERCLYRGPNGLRCFVGVLIPDEKYSRLMDSWDGAIRTSFTEVCATFGVTDYETRDALRALQRIHDNIVPERWHEGLRDFAMCNNLAVPDVNFYLRYYPPTPSSPEAFQVVERAPNFERVMASGTSIEAAFDDLVDTHNKSAVLKACSIGDMTNELRAAGVRKDIEINVEGIA